MKKIRKLFIDSRVAESFINAFITSAFFIFTHGIFNTWLAYSDIKKSTIGYMSLLSLPFSFKPLWAGLLDAFHIPFLSKHVYYKRAWFSLMLIFSSISIYFISFFDIKSKLMLISIIIFFINFFIATADIQEDAYRIELATDDEQSIFTSYAVMGYRIGMFLISTLTLLFIDNTKDITIFSDGANWKFALRFLSLFLFCITLFAMFFFKKNEKYIVSTKFHKIERKNILSECFYKPIFDFIKNNNSWLLIFLFILMAKAPDVIALNMLTPFLKELGFTISEVVIVNKTFGFSATLLGAFCGGLLCLKIGLKRAIFIGLIIQAISNIFFIFQNKLGHNLPFLYISMCVESFCNGCATSAFLGFMSLLSSKCRCSTTIFIYFNVR